MRANDGRRSTTESREEGVESGMEQRKKIFDRRDFFAIDRDCCNLIGNRFQ